MEETKASDTREAGGIMDIATLVCAWLADRIVSDKEQRVEHERLQDEIEKFKLEMYELKDGD